MSWKMFFFKKLIGLLHTVLILQQLKMHGLRTPSSAIIKLHTIIKTCNPYVALVSSSMLT